MVRFFGMVQVSGRITGSERIPEPTEINEALAGIYGRNPFGGGLYRVVWGQTEVMHVRGMDKRYTEMLVGHDKPIWLLQRWCSPEMFWTPELYYEMSADDDGLSLTGEYPQFGRYDTFVSFMSRRIEGDELIIETIPLSFEILESLIPVLEQATQLTMAELEQTRSEMEARENAAKVELIANRLEEALPQRYSAISFSGQTNRTGSEWSRRVERKRKEIAANWKKRKLFERRPRPMLGFYQGKT
jgi:hypothetical protein